MRIDIRNIFDSGGSERPVDVKQVMESGEERLEAAVSSESEPKAVAGASSEMEQISGPDERSGSKQMLETDENLETKSLSEFPDDEEKLSEDMLPQGEKTDGKQEEESQKSEADSILEKSQEKIEATEEVTEPEELETLPQADQKTSENVSDSVSVREERNKPDADEAETELNEEDAGETECSAQDQPEQPETEGSLEMEQEPDPESETASPLASDVQVASTLVSDAQAAPGSDSDAPPASVPDAQAAPKAEATPKAPLQIRKKFLALCRRYGWCTGIAAAFVILLAVTLIYTTLIPREVYATINGKEFSFTTKEYTVEEFLQDEKIAFCEEDYISMPLTTYIYDGIKLEIDHATDFKVTADGKTKKYKTLDNTVQEALDDAGIKLRDRDIVTPSLDAFMTQDIHIVVQRVEVQQEVVEEAIPFQTVTRNDSSLKEGTTKVAAQGQEGKDQVTYEVTYIDGVEAARTEIARESVTAAVDEVIAKGTRIDYNGKTYSRKLVVKAYAYTGGGRTAMGTRARVGEIAVDSGVIPLGTNVYIEGVGARRAEDTGGNIKGNTIDIYMDSEAECRRWGVRYVTIYIQ